jgi:hypothetical protein
MKKLLLLCMVSMLVIGVSSFSPSKKHYTVKIKNAKTTESFEVYAGPGLGAQEVAIYVTRTGPDAGDGYVEFDVDIMYDYAPAHTQTHHIAMSYGQTYIQTNRWTPWIVGTDATPVGDVYNVVYY